MNLIRNRKAWAITISITLMTMFVASVAVDVFGPFEESADDPVGTLQFEELSAGLATDPDRAVDRLVGHVWRFEGPKRTIRGSVDLPFGGGVFWFVDLGTYDGIENRLYLSFANRRDETRFETEEVSIACLITSASVSNNAPDDPTDLGERAIAAKSCRVLEPATNPTSDPP